MSTALISVERRQSWSAVVLQYVVSAIALASVVYPLMIIQPFRAQGPGELLFALAVRRWAPWVTIFCLLAVAGLLWRQRWFRPAGAWAWIVRSLRILLSAICVLGCVGAVWLARFNIFEKMFHPLGAPGFVAAAQAKVSNDEMVMAIKAGGAAHAYPILEMAYHHVVNDYLGQVPVVATY